MARDSSPGPSASEIRRHCTFRRVRASAKFSPLGPAPTMRTGAGDIVSTYGRHEPSVHTQDHHAVIAHRIACPVSKCFLGLTCVSEEATSWTAMRKAIGAANTFGLGYHSYGANRVDEREERRARKLICRTSGLLMSARLGEHYERFGETRIAGFKRMDAGSRHRCLMWLSYSRYSRLSDIY